MSMPQIELLLKALSGVYAQDKSSPGLVLSWIEERQLFYGSVVRYEGRFGQGRVVTYKATGETVDEVVNDLAGQWWLEQGERIARLWHGPDTGL